jgi:hypothetical protein
MNKITKANFKKLVSVLTLTLVMTLGMSISVFAAKGAIKGQDPLVEVANTTVLINGSLPQTGVLYFKAPKNLTVYKASIQLFEKGLATGLLEIDIKKGPTPNPATMVSILNSTITIDINTASDYLEAVGSITNGSLIDGDFISIDVASVPANLQKFFIQIYAR